MTSLSSPVGGLKQVNVANSVTGVGLLGGWLMIRVVVPPGPEEAAR